MSRMTRDRGICQLVIHYFMRISTEISLILLQTLHFTVAIERVSLRQKKKQCPQTGFEDRMLEVERVGPSVMSA